MSNKANLNAVQKFLIWSAGANHEILAREICLTERYKYESIGATVVLTSIMAFFSGGYALFTVFSSVPVSIALGTVWGCIIFNLDRFFILTANKGKSDSRWQLASILRLSIAVLLSLVVATNLLTTILFVIIEISPILVKILSKQGLYEELLEKENKYKTSQEKLRRIKEKEILKLKELKDLELKIEVLIIEYLRLKERNKEKLENIGIDDIQRINKQHEQNNTKFVQICRDKLEHYKYLADEVLGADIN